MAKKGNANTKYGKQQRLEIASRVCELYATNQWTLNSCCENSGISESQFHLWRKKDLEIGDLYIAAKKKAISVNDKQLIEKMTNILEDMAMGKCKSSMETQKVEKKDADGNIIETVTRITEREFVPNPYAASTLLNGALKREEARENEAKIKEAENILPPNIIILQADSAEPCAPLP